jgi:hypothetical protein
MRLDKLTIKSQELIRAAQSLAGEHGNQQIEPEHLLLAMLAEKEGIARSMLRKMGFRRMPFPAKRPWPWTGSPRCAAPEISIFPQEPRKCWTTLLPKRLK